MDLKVYMSTEKQFITFDLYMILGTDRSELEIHRDPTFLISVQINI